MAEIKTKRNDNDVMEFLSAVEPEKKKNDSIYLLEMMKEITGEEPHMWGGSIIGFGDSSYSTSDGKDHKWFKIGFSPRKQNLSLYIMDGFEVHDEEMSKLGKFKTGKSCLYIKKIEDVDEGVLRELIEKSYKQER